MLKRAIKRQFYAAGQHLIAHPVPGLADEALKELTRLITNPVYTNGKFNAQIVANDGRLEIGPIDLRQIPEIIWQNALCRDVELVLYKGHVGSFGEFLQAIKKIEWSQLLDTSIRVSVRCEAFKSRLYHETKLAKALEEQLNSQGFRVTNKEKAEFHIKLYQHKNTLQVALSLSGKPLFKRGYRQHLSSNAPLAEHIAASLIHFHLCGLKAGLYHHEIPLSDLSGVYVPFAGSGTFAFEAISQLLGLLPSLGQRRFAFEAMPLFPEKTVHFVKKKLMQGQKMALTSPFKQDFGLALADHIAISLVENDAKVFEGLHSELNHFERLLADLAQTKVPSLSIEAKKADFFVAPATPQQKIDAKKAHMLAFINPPYGIRLKHRSQSVVGFYHKLASRLVDMSKANEGCYSSLSGLILLASDQAFHGFNAGIKAYPGGHVGRSLSFNQGGRHIRAVEFFLT